MPNLVAVRWNRTCSNTRRSTSTVSAAVTPSLHKSSMFWRGRAHLHLRPRLSYDTRPSVSLVYAITNGNLVWRYTMTSCRKSPHDTFDTSQHRRLCREAQSCCGVPRTFFHARIYNNQLFSWYLMREQVMSYELWVITHKTSLMTHGLGMRNYRFCVTPPVDGLYGIKPPIEGFQGIEPPVTGLHDIRPPVTGLHDVKTPIDDLLSTQNAHTWPSRHSTEDGQHVQSWYNSESWLACRSDEFEHTKTQLIFWLYRKHGGNENFEMPDVCLLVRLQLDSFLRWRENENRRCDGSGNRQPFIQQSKMSYGSWFRYGRPWVHHTISSIHSIHGLAESMGIGQGGQRLKHDPLESDLDVAA